MCDACLERVHKNTNFTEKILYRNINRPKSNNTIKQHKNGVIIVYMGAWLWLTNNYNVYDKLTSVCKITKILQYSYFKPTYCW